MLYRYLYTLFLAVDGNFKLQQKDRKIDDVEIAPGWAYFVKEEDYQAFLAGYVDQPEVFLDYVSHTHFLRTIIRF